MLPTMLKAQEFHTNSATKAIEEMSQRLYKHYEIDDSINGYVVNKIKYGFTIIGPSETKSNTATSKFPQRKTFKQKVVLKSKNKMYWKFSPNQSFTINPSKIDNGITYKSYNSFVTIKQDSFVAGVSITW
jgi:hypothetical protein